MIIDDLEGPDEMDIFDAILIDALSGVLTDEIYLDEIDNDTLPELTDADRAAMESLGTSEEFVARCMKIVDEKTARKRSNPP